MLLCRLSVCCIACGFTFAVFNSPPALQLAHTIRAGGQNFVEKTNLREDPIPPSFARIFQEARSEESPPAINPGVPMRRAPPGSGVGALSDGVCSPSHYSRWCLLTTRSSWDARLAHNW